MRKPRLELISLIGISGISLTGVLGIGLGFQYVVSRAAAPESSATTTAQPTRAVASTTASIATPRSTPAPTSSTAATQPTRLEIDLSQRKVFLYDGATPIKSYPIAIGRQGWETPTGEFEIMHVQQNPAWIDPFTEELIPAGDPQNPLGSYWIGFWTDGRNWIGFHGTPNPETVGRAISHGCIRMYNEDIEALFYQVSPGMPVTVVQ